MKHVVLGEHMRLAREGADFPPDGETILEGHLYDRLRRSDRKAQADGQHIFDWRDGYARTQQWVGVVQVPGLQVEILPKLDALDSSTELAPSAQHTARSNLLYMLAEGGEVPVRNRDIARLATRKAPLSETLAAIFANRLRLELLRGPERYYQEREENLRTFKGKLLIGAHVRANAAHRERFFCRFDELCDDTPLNRIFKAACRLLLALTSTPATQDALRQCLLLLDGVSDVAVREADFAAITLTRQNQRFEDVFRFCRLLLSGRTPSVEAGKVRSFSLLFDMNKVFERFVCSVLCRHVAPRIEGVRIFPQATKHHRYLMQTKEGGVLRLEPDILIEHEGRRLIMDTKWKLLAPGKRGRGGVADDDLRQLHSYLRRYGSARSVLLYPYIPGLQVRHFDVLDHQDELSGEQVAIRHVHLHRNLYKECERESLIGELEAIVREGLGLPT